MPLKIPARLTETSKETTLSELTVDVRGVQTLSAARFKQVRRGNADDRRKCLLPIKYDVEDYWVDEYLGPQGKGWVSHVRAVTTDKENSDNTARDWHYMTHEGPERRNGTFGKWFPVVEDDLWL